MLTKARFSQFVLLPCGFGRREKGAGFSREKRGPFFRRRSTNHPPPDHTGRACIVPLRVRKPSTRRILEHEGTWTFCDFTNRGGSTEAAARHGKRAVRSFQSPLKGGYLRFQTLRGFQSTEARSERKEKGRKGSADATDFVFKHSDARRPRPT